MQAKLIQIKGSWRDVADCANTTIGKPDGEKEPSASWKKRILLSEHSPIRNMYFDFRWTDLKYWVSVHFVRHKLGIEHFVSTQRTDRTQISRDEIPQDSLVTHRISVNIQAMINISRKRLCKNASIETQEAWKAILETLKEKEPEIVSVCVPDCVYRGQCYEFRCCGYDKTSDYKERIESYRNIKSEKS